MSNPRILVTKRQPIIVGHICSNCKNPIIATFTIQVKVEKVVMFSHSRAEKIAIDTADQVIQDNIRRITLCKETCISLADDSFEKTQMLEAGLFSTSSIIDVSTPCPNCEYLEKWQTKSNLEKRDSISDTYSYPIVFLDINLAIKWKQAYLMVKIVEVENLRKNIDEIRKAIEVASVLHSEINLLSCEKESLPEISLKEKLLADCSNAREKKKELRFFDFSAKAALNKVISANYVIIKNIDRLICEKKMEIERAIRQRKVQLQYVQLLAFGSSGDSSVFCSHNATCFVLEANITKDE